jgi:hypothetical protein
VFERVERWRQSNVRLWEFPRPSRIMSLPPACTYKMPEIGVRRHTMAHSTCVRSGANTDHDYLILHLVIRLGNLKIIFTLFPKPWKRRTPKPRP